MSKVGEPTGFLVHARPNPRLRILVAEDDDDIRRLNVGVLRRAGYQVDAAEDGVVAWDALQLQRYDLLVTDNCMPKMSGVELLEKLRVACIRLPVIMATGTVPSEGFPRAPWFQPAVTLLKPYSIVELLETVMEVLRGTASPRVADALPANWQRQPSAMGLRES